LIGGVCAAALALGLAVTYTSTPMYRASATIQIDQNAPKVVKTEATADAPADTGDDTRFYQTQYDLLKSFSLAQRVAADLDLANAPDFLHPKSSSPWAKLWQTLFPARAADGANIEQRKAAAAAMVQNGVTVAPLPNSRIVRISYQGSDPEWASKITNGIADSFISANLDRRFGASAYARTFLKERLDELKLKLEESEKALVSYAEREQIMTGKGQPSLADTDLNSLYTELQKVRTQRIQAEELWDQANKTKGLALAQILNDGSIQKLRGKRAELMSEYQDKLNLFKPDYPDMRKIKAQIDQIDREIQLNANAIKEAIKTSYESLMQQESLLQKNIDDAKAKVLDARNKNIQYQILQRESDTNRSLYDGLLQQYKDIGVAGAVGTNNVAIIDRANRPSVPFSPSLSKNLLISLILGLLTAAAAIAVFEIIDDSFKSPEEIEEQLGLAVLGIIPKTEGHFLSLIKDEPTSPVAEAYRSFRTALQFSTDNESPKTLVVTSARQGEGKSSTAIALAANLAQLGMKVLLVDADMRNPSAHLEFKGDNRVGLSNVLAGGVSAAQACQNTDIPGLTFMASGRLPPNPAELIAGPNMRSLLALASESFDMVIVDAPPVLGLADAPLLASMSAATVLVVAAGGTRRNIVKGALKRLYFARAAVVGAVLNKYDFKSIKYGYGYGYGYGVNEHYGYRADTAGQLEHSSKG
jgi:polysaccharide biosynthesis transport protein